MQKRFVGGCHLDRDIGALIEAAGFEIAGLRTFTIPGPATASFLYTGHATVP
jgi:hypothetical protein